MLGGYRAAGCRSHRANVEARASGDFGHGPSPQGSRLRKHLGGARKPHAVVLMTFKSCSSACVATLSTCSSAVISNFSPAHVRALCSAGRSLDQPAFAKFSAEPAHRIIFCSCSSAYVATLSTRSWTAQSGTHAPSIWTSARFAGLRCEHAICTMMLSFMRYTIAGEEPRAPRPVP